MLRERDETLGVRTFQLLAERFVWSLDVYVVWFAEL